MVQRKGAHNETNDKITTEGKMTQPKTKLGAGGRYLHFRDEDKTSTNNG